MEEIELNGKKYVLKTDAISEESNGGIMDSTNCFIILSGLDEKEGIMKTKKPNLNFKYSCEYKDLKVNIKHENIYTPRNTKLDFELVKRATRVLNELTGNNAKEEMDFKIYEAWEEELKQYKKDFPVLFYDKVQGYGFTLAPIRDNKD